MATTQKAYVLPEKQAPQEVIDFPIPAYKPDEVLIRVESAALNPLDWKIAVLGVYAEVYPAVLGSDGAGVIVEVGSDVTKFQKGDRVVFQGNILDPRTTTYQQYAAAREFIVAKLPDSIPFDTAVPYPASGMAAAVALFKYLEIKAPWAGKHNNNEYILIWGGSSSVGQIAIQIAKNSGLKVITTGSPSNFKRLESLGAEYVINYHDADAIDQIRAITGDNLIYAFDISGPSTAQQCWEALSSSKPAKLVTISGPPDVAANPDKYPAKKNVEIFRSIGFPYVHSDIGEEFIKLIPKWLEEGKFIPLNTELLEGGLRGIQHGQDQLRSGKVSSLKFITHPQETH